MQLDPNAFRLVTRKDLIALEGRLNAKLAQLLEEVKMAITDIASAAAAITAETSTLNAILAAENALKGTSATIADAIAALQAQVANNQTLDFSPIQAAVAANDAAISSISAALQAQAAPAPAPTAPAGS